MEKSGRNLRQPGAVHGWWDASPFAGHPNAWSVTAKPRWGSHGGSHGAVPIVFTMYYGVSTVYHNRIPSEITMRKLARIPQATSVEEQVATDQRMLRKCRFEAGTTCHPQCRHALYKENQSRDTRYIQQNIQPWIFPACDTLVRSLHFSAHVQSTIE